MLAYCGKYLGAILIVLGLVFLWQGYKVFDISKFILVGAIVWAVLFGLAYNLFPS